LSCLHHMTTLLRHCLEPLCHMATLLCHCLVSLCHMAKLLRHCIVCVMSTSPIKYDYITLVTFVLLLYLLSSFKTMLHISIQWRKYWFSQMTTLFCLSLIRQHLWSVHVHQPQFVHSDIFSFVTFPCYIFEFNGNLSVMYLS
jgi:hypothetical protein